MSTYFNVSGRDIKVFSANEAMRIVVEGLSADTFKTIEIVDSDMVNSNQDNEQWLDIVESMDVIVTGNMKLLNMTGVSDKRLMKDVSMSAFIKMFLKYMSRHNKKIFLIALNPDELKDARDKFSKYYEISDVEGMSVSELTGRSEEEIINEINALEPDCILSVLPSPKQEEFISHNRAFINARIWLGCGEVFNSFSGSNVKRNLLKLFKKDKNNM